MCGDGGGCGDGEGVVWGRDVVMKEHMMIDKGVW